MAKRATALVYLVGIGSRGVLEVIWDGHGMGWEGHMGCGGMGDDRIGKDGKSKQSLSAQRRS